jgi:hypothetical protein
MSGRAAVDPSEMVAEAVADVLFAPRPAKLSQEVYELVTSTFDAASKDRSLLWWAS